jgi:hypothetical protein
MLSLLLEREEAILAGCNGSLMLGSRGAPQ